VYCDDFYGILSIIFTSRSLAHAHAYSMLHVTYAVRGTRDSDTGHRAELSSDQVGRPKGTVTAKASLSLKMGPIGFPETSVQNYHSMLRNIPEE
jgi:hypothetical protein